MELCNYLGSNKYKTSAFCIIIDLPIDSNNFIHNLNDNQYSLYLHEYMHFLQDISTAYGLMKLSNTLLYTKAQAVYAIDKKIKEIKVPAYVSSDIKSYSYVKRNFSILPTYIGDTTKSILRNCHNFNNKEIRIISYKEKEIIKPNINDKIKYLELIIEDNKNNRANVIFGGEIICENMASLVEREYVRNVCNNQNSSTNEYPYYLAEKLAKYIYPELERLSNEYFFLMMDLCLTETFNPGYVFYLLVKELKKANFINNINDNDLLNIFNKITNGGRYKLHEIYEEINYEIEQVFYLPMFEGNKEWLKTEFKRLSFLRQNKLIMRCFMQYNNQKISRTAKMIMDILGHPTIKNDAYEAIIKPPSHAFHFHQVQNISLWYFEAYKEVFLALNNKNYKCQMYNDCFRSKIIKTKVDDTETCPEQIKIYNATTTNSLCPFGVFWRSLGLWGKKVAL